MTILAQNGYALGDGNRNKVLQGLRAGSLSGVVMSPNNLAPKTTKNRLAEIADNFPHSMRLVDPQAYVAFVGNRKDKNLQKYDHYQPTLNGSIFNPSAKRRLVEKTIEWQLGLEVSAIMSPTVAIDAFEDAYDQLAFDLARESIEQYSGDKPLFVNLLISENALFQTDAIESWVLKLHELSANSFYLVVLRDDGNYTQSFRHVSQLVGLLRICHQLASISRHVLVGYCDMLSLMLHAVGVSGTCTGWWHNLRQFTIDRFVDDDSIRLRGVPRYSSRPLINPISAEVLIGLQEAGTKLPVLSRTPYDLRFSGDAVPTKTNWTINDATYHQWSVLNDLVSNLDGCNISERIDIAENMITESMDLRDEIGLTLLTDDKTDWQHHEQWIEAMNQFRINYLP